MALHRCNDIGNMVTFNGNLQKLHPRSRPLLQSPGTRKIVSQLCHKARNPFSSNFPPWNDFTAPCTFAGALPSVRESPFMPLKCGSTSFYCLFAGTVAKPIIQPARRRSWKNAKSWNNESRSKGISKREVVPFIVAQTSNCQGVKTLGARKVYWIARTSERIHRVASIGPFICLFVYTSERRWTNLPCFTAFCTLLNHCTWGSQSLFFELKLSNRSKVSFETH